MKCDFCRTDVPTFYVHSISITQFEESPSGAAMAQSGYTLRFVTCEECQLFRPEETDQQLLQSLREHFNRQRPAVN